MRSHDAVVTTISKPRDWVHGTNSEGEMVKS
jgi:hypothetical protein